ncbi:MAG: hypothetical protein M3340_00360 [Actinomycetota bacterium]|nr:hypothetical protein [Actinomycetota bacterium]
MDDARKELLATYRSEAASFFAANQAARNAAERATALLFSVVAVAVSAGVASDSWDVALPLPSLTLLLFAHACNQYSDLTVLGMGRAHIERRVDELLGEDALIYEIALAPVRKHSPLSRSIRFLQLLVGLLILAVVVVGTVVAFDHQPVGTTVAYCAATAASLVAALVSYTTMLQTPRVATDEIASVLASRAAERRASSD